MVAVEVEETDELRDFRETWNREVQERKRQQQQQQSLQDSADPSTAAPKQTSTSESQAQETGTPERSGASRLRDDALGVYTRAVKHEQADELDEALRLYRQAFRMDSNVDKVYHLREQRAARILETTSLTATPPEQHNGKEAVISVRSGSDAVAPRVVQTKPPSAHHLDRQISGLLAGIVAGFPRPLSFEPEDERAWSPLQRLPDELLVHILSYLGVAAIERFARVSRKARMITLDTTIWRSGFSLPFFPYARRRSFVSLEPFSLNFKRLFPRVVIRWTNRFLLFISFRPFVETIYKPPQISPDETLDDIVDKHSSDYRRVHIERPRVRLDGVYIAVCHYMYLLSKTYMFRVIQRNLQTARVK
jgi:F-box protein 9